MTQENAFQSFDFPVLHKESVAALNAFLENNRYCYLMRDGEANTQQPTEFIDTQTGVIYSPLNENLNKFLEQQQFVYICKAGTKVIQATLQVATELLWSRADSANSYTLEEAQKLTHKKTCAQLKGWQIPSERQLRTFVHANNPFCTKEGFLIDVNGKPSDAWLTKAGVYNYKEDTLTENPKSSAPVIFYNNLWENRSSIHRCIDLATQQWQLATPDNKIFEPSKIIDTWPDCQAEQLLVKLKEQRLHLKGIINKKAIFETSKYGLMIDKISEIDFIPCRLPKLNELQIRDPEQGLWELFGIDKKTLKHFGVIARDPAQDIKRYAVAIDFGTSSTVVAIDTSSGKSELLRIGVRDFHQQVQPADFENPTVLECIDFRTFEAVWTQQAYRPALNWNWMRAAHEAQANLRDNPGETQILASIMPSLKRWALRSSEQRRTRITDRTDHEITLAPHTERNPVRGQPLTLDANNYPFDPVELYAWFLGMAINWRNRGIFLDYYLSFPVKYAREVKDRILASFRRGLQRSLPQTLITHHPEVLNDFKVHDLASEPAAYAAAALKHLKIQPTEEGVPYAVFDFGGGTSDFDYGLLRWATEDEEDQGYEQVFEHLASSGDNYLGGENLLENLVYSTFCQNLETLRAQRIQFTQPDGTETFPGSEAFLADTQAAQTNVIMLAAKLRAFLEADEPKLEDQINLTLINNNGEKADNCALTLNAEALDALLLNKIRAGLEAFLTQLAQLRDKLPRDESIHVLLAGNGCRSRHIKHLTQGAEWIKLSKQAFGNKVPDIVVHEPLPMNEAEPYAPTTKTGVALGLLRLTPGKNTLLINHVHNSHNGQAPFAWFVGRMRRGMFDSKLNPGAVYGKWHEIGALQQGIFNLYASSSPRAHQGIAEGDVELKMLPQDFHAAPPGAKLFARAIKPHEIELTAALDPQEIDENSNIITLELE